MKGKHMRRKQNHESDIHELVRVLVHGEHRGQGENRTPSFDYFREYVPNTRKAAWAMYEHLGEMLNGQGASPNKDKPEPELPWDDVPSRKTDLIYWVSDKRMIEDYKLALKRFHHTARYFWVGKWVEARGKTAEEIEGFLESIEDLSYDDLTPGQRGQLGVIRRAHMEWVKSQ
jgi:hypothetical protein